MDAVSGLPHRRRFGELLAAEVERARERREPLSLALFDLDDFGAVNRRYGHQTGDAVLREAAERTAALVALDDPLARIGPDEFAILLRDADLLRAEAFLRGLRRELAANPVPELGRLTIAGAAAELDSGEDAATFFQRADAALSSARAGGGLLLAADSWAATPSP
jgi:diguanylate cyclase (GGDEF)-like protein